MSKYYNGDVADMLTKSDRASLPFCIYIMLFIICNCVIRSIDRKDVIKLLLLGYYYYYYDRYDCYAGVV